MCGRKDDGAVDVICIVLGRLLRALVSDERKELCWEKGTRAMKRYTVGSQQKVMEEIHKILLILLSASGAPSHAGEL